MRHIAEILFLLYNGWIPHKDLAEKGKYRWKKSFRVLSLSGRRRILTRKKLRPKDFKYRHADYTRELAVEVELFNQDDEFSENV